MESLFTSARNIIRISSFLNTVPLNVLRQEIQNWEKLDYYNAMITNLNLSKDELLATMNTDFIKYYAEKVEYLNNQKPNYIGGINRNENMQTYEDKLILDMMGPYVNQQPLPKSYDGWGYGAVKGLNVNYLHKFNIDQESWDALPSNQYSNEITDFKNKKSLHLNTGLLYKKID